MTEELRKLLENLYDPEYDFMDHYFELEQYHLPEVWSKNNDDPLVQELIYQFLLRMRHASPHLFVFNLQKYNNIHKLGDIVTNIGLVDKRGYSWLTPSTFGRFNMSRFGGV